MKQRAGWTNILEKSYGGSKQGRNVYINNLHYPLYENLIKNHKGNYYLTTVYRAIMSLNADASSGQALNGAATLRFLEKDGFGIEFIMDDGDVLIEKLHYDSEFKQAGTEQETGLYKTLRSNMGLWETKKDGQLNMDVGHKWGGAHYAAVSGKFGTKEKAGMGLINHIKKAYGGKEILEKDMEKQDNFYSLYWINKEHKELKTADNLASIFQQATDSKASVNWLVHGEGAKTFAKAMDILKHQPSLSRFAASDNDSVRHLQADMGMQKVFFSNPIGLSEAQLKELCENVGVTYAGANINPRNLFNAKAQVNTFKEVVNISAKSAATGVGGATLGALGLTAVTKNGPALVEGVGNLVTNPTIGTAAVAAGVAWTAFQASKSAFTKMHGSYRALRAATATTFGRGNEYWYESDENLLEQMSA